MYADVLHMVRRWSVYPFIPSSALISITGCAVIAPPTDALVFYSSSTSDDDFKFQLSEQSVCNLWISWIYIILTKFKLLGISRAWMGLLIIDTGLLILMLLKASKMRRLGTGKLFSILLRDGKLVLLSFTMSDLRAFSGTIYYL